MPTRRIGGNDYGRSCVVLVLVSLATASVSGRRPVAYEGINQWKAFKLRTIGTDLHQLPALRHFGRFGASKPPRPQLPIFLYVLIMTQLQKSAAPATSTSPNTIVQTTSCNTPPCSISPA